MNPPKNKTNALDEQIVRNHIDSIPIMESHYTRKSTMRLHLDSKLTISKMFQLYQDYCEENQ